MGVHFDTYMENLFITYITGSSEGTFPAEKLVEEDDGAKLYSSRRDNLFPCIVQKKDELFFIQHLIYSYYQIQKKRNLT